MRNFFSMLDTDLYKFSTSYAYMKLFPDAECTFTFIDRNHKIRNKEFFDAYKAYLKAACNVHLTRDEHNWCVKNIPYIPECYWDWLLSFRFDFNKIDIRDICGELYVSVTDKCWKASLYEIICLFAVTEVSNTNPDWDIVIRKLADKISFANNNNIKFSEFGTRRRYNFEVQESVIEYIKDNSATCVGTSNVLFAKEYNMKPIGTHPHEWFMFHGAQFGYKHANYIALENWVNVYDGNLGIALTDTYTTDVFFSNFSMKHAKLFDGLRQDSGSEINFITKACTRYKELGVDPKTKTIVFSNSLDFNKALKIQNKCEGKINCSFGIGTNLTNDCGITPENIVMKMTKCRMNASKPWMDCVKLSDDIEKATGDIDEVSIAKLELDL